MSKEKIKTKLVSYIWWVISFLLMGLMIKFIGITHAIILALMVLFTSKYFFEKIGWINPKTSSFDEFIFTNYTIQIYSLCIVAIVFLLLNLCISNINEIQKLKEQLQELNQK